MPASKQRRRRRELAANPLKEWQPNTADRKKLDVQAKDDFQKSSIVKKHLASRQNASLQTALEKAEKLREPEIGEYNYAKPPSLAKATHVILSSDKQKSLQEIEREKQRRELIRTAIKLYIAECKLIFVEPRKFTELESFQQKRFLRIAGSYLAGTYKGTLRI